MPAKGSASRDAYASIEGSAYGSNGCEWATSGSASWSIRGRVAALETPAGIAENDLTRVSATGVVAAAFARSNWFATPTPDGGLLTVGSVIAQKTAPSGGLAWSFDAAPHVATKRWSAHFAPHLVDTAGHLHLAASSVNSDWSPLVELDAAGKELSRIQVDDWQYAIAVTPKRRVYTVGGSAYGILTHTP